MSGASLLTRLEIAADPSASGRSVYRGEDLESVVIRHLKRMLNTRAGSSLTAPDYGIIELSELIHDFPNATGIMQRSIKNTISKHEPRLRNIQVRSVESEVSDPMNVHFEITGQLVYPDGERQAVRFNTSVDESSNVTFD
ncbi:MAG: type VI secretion system baseplate subunit TssE [Polyangiaceae bacterium]